jgi:hypothetical protein
MFARLQTAASTPLDESMVPAVADMIGAHPGFAGLVILADGDSGTMISLWHSREDAELASQRTAAIRGPRPFELVRDEIYEVDADQAGVAAGESANVAFLGEFGGPMSQAALDAARFAGTQRIGPALRTAPGLVRVLVFWHPVERRMAVLHLATSPEALQTVGEIVMSSTLLPGEDPELLPGPDRVTMPRVVAYRTAAVASSR